MALVCDIVCVGTQHNYFWYHSNQKGWVLHKLPTCIRYIYTFQKNSKLIFKQNLKDNFNFFIHFIHVQFVRNYEQYKFFLSHDNQYYKDASF